MADRLRGGETCPCYLALLLSLGLGKMQPDERRTAVRRILNSQTLKLYSIRSVRIAKIRWLELTGTRGSRNYFLLKIKIKTVADRHVCTYQI